MDYVEVVSARKESIKRGLDELLSKHEIAVAREDPHAKRPPRPCGITIHTGIGCPYACRYCYVYDMGFPEDVKPYPLSGVQLVYALVLNKYFIPGNRGTYLAIGSVSEPFHPLLRSKTLEFVEAIYKYLGNPTQFSTKQYIDSSTAGRLAEYSNGKVSPLVTIITLDNYSELEPRQTPPEKRLESIRNLREAGLKPFLFMRPIIPGLTEREYEEIIDLAVENGAVGVVVGGLRVTRRIIENLRETGLDTREIHRRLRTPLEKMKPGLQYDVYTTDIKTRIMEYARKRGIIAFPSACMANLYTHGLACRKMRIFHGNVDAGFDRPSRDEIKRIILKLGGELENYFLHSGKLDIWVKCERCDEKVMSELIRSRFLTCTTIHVKRRK